MDIKIRKAKIADAELLTHIGAKTFFEAFNKHPKNAPEDMEAYMNEAFTVQRLTQELSDKNAIFLLAEGTDEIPAGYAKLQNESIEDGITAARPIELCRLYVHQDFLGQGIAQALMNECLAISEKLDRDVIWLGVWEYNFRAQRFYEKYGFKLCGEHVFQLGNDPQTDYLMQRTVKL